MVRPDARPAIPILDGLARGLPLRLFSPEAPAHARIAVSVGGILAEYSGESARAVVKAKFTLALEVRRVAPGPWAIDKDRLYRVALIEHFRRHCGPPSNVGAIDAASELYRIDPAEHDDLPDALAREKAAGTFRVARRQPDGSMILAFPVKSHITPLHALAWGLSDAAARAFAEGRAWLLCGRGAVATVAGALPMAALSSLRLLPKCARADDVPRGNLLNVPAPEVPKPPRRVPEFLLVNGANWRRDVRARERTFEPCAQDAFKGAIGIAYSSRNRHALLLVEQTSPPDSGVVVFTEKESSDCVPRFGQAAVAALFARARKVVKADGRPHGDM